MSTLIGINTEGSGTHGAAYAREHHDDLPDGFKADKRIVFRRLAVRTGEVVRMNGVPVMIMAGVKNVSIVVDARRVPREEQDKRLPLHSLFLWKGYHWFVVGVHGTFLNVALWGTRRRKQGFRLEVRDGVTFAELVKP